MNDRYDAGYGGDQYELVGYDEFGQPVYRQVPPRQDPPQQVPQQQSYDPYAQQQSYGYHQQDGRGGYDRHDGQGYVQQAGQGYAQQTGQGYGYDPYGTGQQPPAPSYDPYDTGRQDPAGHDPYGTAPQQSAPTPYDPYGQGATSGRQPRAESRVAEQTAYIPQQAGPAADEDTQPPQDQAEPQREYRTEQFAFVEDPDAESEDVIDWLNFTENRTERREEAKRRARSRLVALVVVLALVAVGGVGYLWYAGKLPGLSSSAGKKTGTGTAPAAQKRDVIVVHLHDTSGGGTATALLVDNTTTRQGTTVLLPNSLVLTGDDGTTTTLAKSVDDDGSSGTREALDTVLGTDIQGTWRLDTPYLQNLVDLVGTIEIDTDTDVPDPAAKKKGSAPLVHKGGDQTLTGKMAVAYATYRAEGEAQNAQLERFGQVMQGVLRKISSDAQAATVTVQTLAQILDPSLTDKDLGTFLAKLADLAKGGDYKTAVLPVQADGTLSAEASASVVKDVLGGTAKSPDQDAAVSVSVQNASGRKADTENARVVLLNGGFTFVEAGTAATDRATSTVLYADAADKENATEVAKTLGLPAGAVTKGTVPGNADVAVVLGKDYKPSSS
ncbi:LCP family protein [Streptomyces galbus]|uniref:LytR family transcriptional regulator n=1 Tax=Streptomyces galbus TaxID=33898 RepID=A0A4U5XCT7_STRGB|nr:LCP family protein [Streptomyces galbus]TKT11506.1 LytR family transcriptional regulator [Streptomyces galbus]GHD30610.1 membrane protein [Streptomyces galbus]